MIELEYAFEKRPWEQALQDVAPGTEISAACFLSLLENEDELTVEEALSALENKGIALNVRDLPPVELTGSAALRLKQEAKLHTPEAVTTGLDENDPLRLYLEELAATPAAGDPQLLAERYLAGEHHLAEMLVNLCLSRVVAIAMEYTGYGVLLLDLIQEGSMGLWQGILQYTGGEFETFSNWWIRQYMARAVFLQAKCTGIGQKMRQNLEDYRDIDQRLLAELGRNATIEEIAEALHITTEECAVLERMVASAGMMEKVKQEEQPPEPTPEDDLAVEDTAYFQVRQRIMELLSGLPAQDAELLRLRFGLEGGKPLSPVETGKRLGLTPQQVVSREAAALGKLRNQ